MTELRIPEDQMQRLMRCILASSVNEITFAARWKTAERILVMEPEFDTMPSSDFALKQMDEPKPEPEQDLKDKLSRMEIQWDACETLNAELNSIITEQANEIEQLKSDLGIRKAEKAADDNYIEWLKNYNDRLKAHNQKLEDICREATSALAIAESQIPMERAEKHGLEVVE